MGKDTPRHFVTVRERHFWTPAPKLRAAGWTSQPLGLDRGPAVARAIELNAEVDRWRAAGSPTRGDASPAAVRSGAPGSVAALIDKWQASEHYPKKASTKRHYDYSCRYLRSWLGPLPARSVTPRMCKDRYIALHKITPGAANSHMRVGQALFSSARLLVDPGHPLFVALRDNPFAELDLEAAAPSAIRWTEAERDAVAGGAAALGWHSLGMAIGINWWLGQREGDILALARNALEGTSLVIGQGKTAARVDLPIGIVPLIQSARLAAEERQRQAEAEAEAARHRIGSNGGPPLARVESLTHLLVNERTGKPWDEHAFRKAVRKARWAAAMMAFIENRDADGERLLTLTFMHLRHTAVCEMYEAACTIPEIASVTGHTLNSVHQILERYGLRTKALAAKAFQRRLAKEQGDGSG